MPNAELAISSRSPSRYQRRLLLLVFLGLFALSGASCPQFLQQYTNPPPRVLPPSPTLEQVIDVVNRNNSQIQSFSANNASITGSGFPSLRASVAFQRQKRFRLRAETGLTGAEFDLGSNDELFWFWVRREQPPAMYYCRHDQFASSQARLTTPIQPEWLIEAMGVAEFDPVLPHQGPYALPNDRLEIRTVRETPEGPAMKVTIIDGSQGWILEQHLFDARRQLMASSIAGKHRRDPLSGSCSTLLRLPPGLHRDAHALDAAQEWLVLDGALRRGGIAEPVPFQPRRFAARGAPDLDLADARVGLEIGVV
jgi:hypothetical protein